MTRSESEILKIRRPQRIAPVSLVMTPAFHEWMARENEHDGANVFISVNTFSPRLVSRLGAREN